jgi:hypothetical protein
MFRPLEKRASERILLLGLFDILIGLAALMLVIGANMSWVRISVVVPFAGQLAVTAAGTEGLGTDVAIGGALALLLVALSLLARAVLTLGGELERVNLVYLCLRWSAFGYLLIAAALFIMVLVNLWRYYQSAHREVFLGIRLIDLFDFAVNWLDLRLTPQLGLIISGLGLILLLAGAMARTGTAMWIEKPVSGANRERSTLKLIMSQTNGTILEIALSEAVTLGRGEDNDIVIPDRQASRRHAEIRREGKDYMLRDRQSTNGVRVNGQRISAAYRLQSGDRIQIGKTIFEVQSAKEPNQGSES